MTPYEQLIEHVRQTALLEATSRLLTWDQETFMPAGRGAVEYRSRQLAQLAGLIHDRQTDARMGDWLGMCESDAARLGDPHAIAATNVREIRRDYDRAVKLPVSLVRRFSEAASLGRHAWVEARRRNEFAIFRPHLQTMIELCRDKARCWGAPRDGELWDALADWHEPGMSARQVSQLFGPLRMQLVELLEEVLARPAAPEKASRARVPVAMQLEFSRKVAEQLGFDFSRGRCDESSHPFCLPLHREDVRMTGRYRQDLVLDGLGSTMHETGHGLYNQNLPADAQAADTPAGLPLRYAIHESQARLVENHVGRSRSFWRWCGPLMRRHMPQLADASDEDLYRASNIVRRSLIRTEADELTYHLHILVRFELERAMMAGDLSAGDLPGAWAEKYHTYLGVEVPDDARGCMQDIHWAQGAIGYFPTYTLGSLYAAQFYEAARAAITDLDAQIAAGDFRPLVQWLTGHVHRHGRRYTAQELCRSATGRDLSPMPMLDHLRAKLLEHVARAS